MVWLFILQISLIFRSCKNRSDTAFEKYNSELVLVEEDEKDYLAAALKKKEEQFFAPVVLPNTTINTASVVVLISYKIPCRKEA